MNKKEQARFDQLEHNLRLAKALSWTQPIAPDVPVPAPFGGKTTQGFCFNVYSSRVDPACSESHSHYCGAHKMPSPGMGSQRGIELYSTRLLALKALRHEVEKEVAARLAAIDKQIEHELTLDASPNGTE